MTKEITIFTKDNNNTYKLRNKLLQEDLQSNYLNSAEDLVQYLKYSESGILIVDAISYINLGLNQNKDKFVIVVLDEENMINESDIESNLVVSNFTNILNDFPIAKAKYLKKIGVNDLLILNKVTEKLAQFSISPKSLGYKYLQDCLVIAFKNGSKFLCYKTDVYPQVAKAYNVSIGAIEKSIRTSITKASKLFPQLFNSNDFRFGKVTNNQFMNYIIERMNYENSLLLI